MRTRAWLAIFTMAIAAVTASSKKAAAELIYGVTKSEASRQLLIGWDSSDPATIWSVLDLSSTPILGIDATPYANAIWMYGGNGVIVRHNFTNNGSLSGTTVPVPSGLTWGFEYNPVLSPPPVDQHFEFPQFNVVSDLDANESRLLSSATTLPALAYAVGDVNQSKDPSVFGIAFTNNVPGALTTTLYGIDSARDALVTVDVLTGALHTVGSLGVDVISQGEFDISGNTGIAYATMKRANSSQSEFWTINLASGAATSVGAIGGGITVTALTVAIPEPTTLALMAMPLAIVAASRRRR